jgi:hypothetical protein
MQRDCEAMRLGSKPLVARRGHQLRGRDRAPIRIEAPDDERGPGVERDDRGVGARQAHRRQTNHVLGRGIERLDVGGGDAVDRAARDDHQARVEDRHRVRDARARERDEAVRRRVAEADDLGAVEDLVGDAAGDDHAAVAKERGGVARTRLLERGTLGPLVRRRIVDDAVGARAAPVARPAAGDHHAPVGESHGGMIGAADRKRRHLGERARDRRVALDGAGDARAVETADEEHVAVGEEGRGVAGAARGQRAGERRLDRGARQELGALARGLAKRGPAAGDEDRAVRERRRRVPAARFAHRARRHAAAVEIADLARAEEAEAVGAADDQESM